MNKIEMSLIKYALARFKSKSPKGYALLFKIGIIISIMAGGYIYTYNEYLLSMHNAILGNIDNACIVIASILTGAGIVAKSTTTDPNLVSDETKANIIQQHADSSINK